MAELTGIEQRAHWLCNLRALDGLQLVLAMCAVHLKYYDDFLKAHEVLKVRIS